MNSNQQLIHNFYIAFQKTDYKTMQECYADNATFSDPVFVNLDAMQVRTMWEMFCVKSTDLVVEYKNVVADEHRGSAEWKATYTFSATGKKIVNHITSEFIFENGKIVQHNDTFDFYTWAKQALGFKGFLLGWTSFVKQKVQQTAMRSLQSFATRKKR